jgi:dienelactone hydrolase
MRTGIVHPFAGDGGLEFAGEGKPYLQASFATPVGLARGRSGIYVADMRAHRVRLLDERTGTVITVAGGKEPRNPVIPWRFVYRKEDVVREQDVPVPFRVAGMDAVTVQQDLRYADDALRRFDLYRPPGNERLPVVVLISGRNDTEVLPDTWGLFESRARILAAAGFAAVMFNHRLGLNGSIVQGAEDLALLLRALERPELNLDTSNVSLVAYAMGTTALPALMRNPPRNLRSIVAFYPYADVRELANWQAPGKTDENAERFSMGASFVDGVAVPRMLLIRAGRDAPHLLKGVDTFVAEALKKNAPIELINHPGGAAAFDREAADSEVPEIMQRVIEFLRR